MQKKWKTSHFGQWRGWVNFKDMLFSLNVSFEFNNHLEKQGMVQWWEHWPPINVARVQIPASTPYVGWVCCWFSPLLWEIFLQVLRFFPLLKNQHFQIPIWPGFRKTKNHFVDVLTPNHYLFIYLFIYLYLAFDRDSLLVEYLTAV